MLWVKRLLSNDDYIEGIDLISRGVCMDHNLEFLNLSLVAAHLVPIVRRRRYQGQWGLPTTVNMQLVFRPLTGARTL